MIGLVQKCTPKFNSPLLRLRIKKMSKEALHIFCNAFASLVLFTLSSLLFYFLSWFLNQHHLLFTFFSQRIIILMNVKKARANNSHQKLTPKN
jgi:hypothetical protein